MLKTSLTSTSQKCIFLWSIIKCNVLFLIIFTVLMIIVSNLTVYCKVRFSTDKIRLFKIIILKFNGFYSCSLLIYGLLCLGNSSSKRYSTSNASVKTSNQNDSSNTDSAEAVINTVGGLEVTINFFMCKYLNF